MPVSPRALGHALARLARAAYANEMVLSAGILLWRRRADDVAEVLLGHFGGPLWAKKDAGAWAIPKGLVEAGETAEQAARREFQEELGFPAEGELVPLGRIRQKGGKIVAAFALEGDLDAAAIRSNTFSLEWPPRTGRTQSFPEIDRAGWFSLAEAREKILPSQLAILDALKHRLARIPYGNPNWKGGADH